MGLLAVSIPVLYSMDEGHKFIRNYDYLEYDHQPQNWGMTQAKNGILYFANQGGVLEYDGVSWRVYYEEGKTLRSLAIDESGIVYLGGENEIWYLEPDSTGTLTYVSLLQHLDEKHKNFGTIWSTHAIKNKAYFRTTKNIFIWDQLKMIAIDTADRFKSSFVHNGELLVQDGKKGLLKVVNDTLQPIPGGEFFAGTRISVFTPFSDKSGDKTILVGNRKPEFFLYEDETITPFHTEAEDFLKLYKPNHGIRLSSGDFALATNKGLVIIGPDGKLKSIIDKTYGLQDDEIKHVFRDKWGNIWLCTYIGISKIEYNSPFSIVKATSQLPGLTMTVVRHKNKLYTGTTRGVFHHKSGSTFVQVPGVSVFCTSLATNGSHLFASTDEGVFWIDNDRPVKITNERSFSLSVSKRYPGLIWCGTGTGFLVALENRNGKWLESFRSKPLNNPVHSIAEASDGSLWLGTSGTNVLRVRFSNGFNEPDITAFDSNHGLMGSESYAAKAAGHVIVATSKGIFKYNRETNTFIPDPLLGETFAGGEKSKPVFRITEGRDREIWFNSQSQNYLAIPKREEQFEIIDRPFRRMPLIQANAIYPDPLRDITWFARHDGLYGYDTTVKKEYAQSFTALIRKVVLNESSANPIELFNDHPDETYNAVSLPVPRIDFKNRHLYFEYAAPFFESENEIQYQCLLEGYDNEWTAWNRESKRNYTNLEPGTYRFRVRAKNVYGTVSEEDQYRFRILPPWYWTWWMVSLYTIFFLFSIYQVIRWRSRKLIREKQRLETTVNDRTKEINEKNLQLERQTLQLQNQSEKLKEMDRVKSRFFANISHEFRTPLTLILGPLEQMFSDSKEDREKKKINTMLRNTQRLLNLINQLLDLSRLDSGKEKLQAANQNIVPFLKGIIANFENAAEQKKLNLEFQTKSKEITFYFDSQKMERVMNNLLINAVKYTPPNGNITVSVSRSKQLQEKNARPVEFVNISVNDTGPGIPPEHINYIFDRFFQAERFKTEDREGTGIGLALVKEYVELHHGKIDVHSMEGKGSEFVLHFPRGKDHLQPAEITGSPGAEPVSLQPYKNLGTPYEIEETDEIENGGDTDIGEAKASEKPVILVVEDQADVRRYIREPIKVDYSVVEAKDGEEGIEKAKAIIPDLIVSDIMMPGKDGYELCNVLKKDIKTSHIPIILLTAKASEESQIQGLETGADDYITKPFSTQILLARIKNLIELRRNLQLKLQKQMLLQPDEIQVSSMDREFIKELKIAIEKNLSDSDFGVERLSKAIFMDRTTLFRKIKALTGETPQLFIRSYRLQRAAELLKKKFGTVSQVSSQVGFDNMAYFAKCFKEKYHMTPSSFMAAESTQEDKDDKVEQDEK
jgi:signal transduction histidine kinase/DNA-binding response OmpR family regulator